MTEPTETVGTTAIRWKDCGGVAGIHWTKVAPVSVPVTAGRDRSKGGGNICPDCFRKRVATDGYEPFTTKEGVTVYRRVTRLNTSVFDTDLAL